MSQIYINTKQSEENRVIIAENNKLISYEQEAVGSENKKGDIYKGVITRLEEGLEAAFVDIGEEKNGFLPYKEIPPGAMGVSEGGLREGDNVLVQIKKDHVGDKGAGLTAYITLAGCYFVLQPNHSGRILLSKNSDKKTRAKMLEIVNSLEIPDNMSAILRTAGMECTAEQLKWDLNSYLLRLWEIIQTAAEQTKGSLLIYRENNLLSRIIRNHFRPEEDNIICDDPENYQELRDFISLMYPGNEEKIHYHDSNNSILPEAIEEQIDHVLDREVTTRSGGRVVFDSTEAMVAVDVNSGRFISGHDIEETALATNMEAAGVIASHLRLRNLAGLIVVDFIDMEKEANRKKLEDHFFKLLRQDRARVRCTTLSKFGLIEISRQRLSRSLVSSQATVCPHCQGAGQIWRTESFAIRMLRKIRAVAAGSSMLLVQAPVAVSVFLLNEKRIEIRKIEDDCNCEIIIIPNENMQSPQYNIRPIKGDTKISASHLQVQKKQQKALEEMRESIHKKKVTPPPRKALIKNFMPDQSAPTDTASAPGLFKRITASIKSAFKSDNTATQKTAPKKNIGGARKGEREQRNDRRDNRRDRSATKPQQAIARTAKSAKSANATAANEQKKTNGRQPPKAPKQQSAKKQEQRNVADKPQQEQHADDGRNVRHIGGLELVERTSTAETSPPPVKKPPVADASPLPPQQQTEKTKVKGEAVPPPSKRPTPATADAPSEAKPVATSLSPMPTPPATKAPAPAAPAASAPPPSPVQPVAVPAEAAKSPPVASSAPQKKLISDWMKFESEIGEVPKKKPSTATKQTRKKQGNGKTTAVASAPPASPAPQQPIVLAAPPVSAVETPPPARQYEKIETEAVTPAASGGGRQLEVVILTPPSANISSSSDEQKP